MCGKFLIDPAHCIRKSILEAEEGLKGGTWRQQYTPERKALDKFLEVSQRTRVLETLDFHTCLIFRPLLSGSRPFVSNKTNLTFL